MNLYLIEKILKFKYLSNFIKKSKKMLSLYVFGLKKSNLPNECKSLQIPKNFLKILLTKVSTIKWHWNLLFKGKLSVVYWSNYNFAIKPVKAFIQQNIILGGFFRGYFFSSYSFTWFFSLPQVGQYCQEFSALTRISLLSLLQQSVYKLNFILLSLVKIFFIRFLNVYINSIN